MMFILIFLKTLFGKKESIRSFEIQLFLIPNLFLDDIFQRLFYLIFSNFHKCKEKLQTININIKKDRYQKIIILDN